MTQNVNPQGNNNLLNDYQIIQQYESQASHSPGHQDLSQATNYIITADIVFGALPSSPPTTLSGAAIEYNALSGQATSVSESIAVLIRVGFQAGLPPSVQAAIHDELITGVQLLSNIHERMGTDLQTINSLSP